MSNPVISVLMSVYNADPYLHDAIESILRQTYSNFEFIIINDGSTDSSWTTIQRYADQDQRIIPVNQQNIGLTKSLNKCIKLAKGEFIARQDADDISLPYRFEKQLPWVQEKGYDLCCSRTWLMSAQRPTPRFRYWLPNGLLMLTYNPFIHGTYLMRKDSLSALGCYDERFTFSQDYELMTRWLGYGLRVKWLHEYLYQTRQPDNSISIKHRQEQRALGIEIRKRWRRQVIRSPWLLLR